MSRAKQNMEKEGITSHHRAYQMLPQRNVNEPNNLVKLPVLSEFIFVVPGCLMMIAVSHRDAIARLTRI